MALFAIEVSICVETAEAWAGGMDLRSCLEAAKTGCERMLGGPLDLPALAWASPLSPESPGQIALCKGLVDCTQLLSLSLARNNLSSPSTGDGIRMLLQNLRNLQARGRARGTQRIEGEFS